ncbi:Uncharacterized protein Adt_10265 [Abeliophyllum distichum]|uniref:Uncharacterized protein n=1 Tax=Abeliophyllum distichum TaxID=126358 RepID=A0ABD1UJH9_9LAMI
MLCDVALCHEAKLGKCPLAREPDSSPDCNADPVSSSTALPSSGSTGIAMPFDGKGSVERSTGRNAVDLDCTVSESTAESGDGDFGNRFKELKKIRVLEGQRKEESSFKKYRVSVNLDLRRRNEESLLKKFRVSERLDLECKRLTKCLGKTKPTVIKIKRGEDLNGSEVIDLESEEFGEKTQRDKLGVSHVKICAESGGVADKGESQKIDECRGGSKNTKLQIDDLCEKVVENSENRKSGKITEGEKAYNNVDGDRCLDRAKNVAEVEKLKYVPSAADVGKRREDRVGRAGVSVGGRRELPSLIKGTENNARGNEEAGNVETKNEVLMNFLKVLIRDVDRDGKDVDFLETAKRRGLTFPQPR